MSDKNYPLIDPVYKTRRRRDRKENGEWTVKPVLKGGETDLDNLVMSVPVGNTADGFRTRSHELLHVAFSPVRVRVMDMAALAAEDARIETIAARKGVSPPAHADIRHIRSTLRSLITDGNTAAYAYATAGVGSQDEESIRKTLITMATDGELPEYQSELFAASGTVISGAQAAPDKPDEGEKKQLAREVLDFMTWVAGTYGKSTSRRTGAIVTRKLRKLMDGATMEEKLPGHEIRIGGEGTDPAETGSAEESTRPDTSGWGGAVPPASVNPWKKTRVQSTPSPDPGLAWGEMTLDEPPRTRKLVTAAGHTGLGNSGIKPSDTGSVPRAVHRLTTDQRIFRKRRHTVTGTVLIDCSGSMNLEPDDIRQIVSKVPAAVIAGYSASFHAGTLRIFAKGGTAVDRYLMRIPGGGNVIDGPAVEWLSGQSSPRIWICDGLLTGIGDNYATPKMHKAVRTIMHNGRIVMINPDMDPDWMRTATRIMLGRAA